MINGLIDIVKKNPYKSMFLGLTAALIIGKKVVDDKNYSVMNAHCNALSAQMDSCNGVIEEAKDYIYYQRSSKTFEAQLSSYLFSKDIEKTEKKLNSLNDYYDKCNCDNFRD